MPPYGLAALQIRPPAFDLGSTLATLSSLDAARRAQGGGLGLQAITPNPSSGEGAALSSLRMPGTQPTVGGLDRSVPRSLRLNNPGAIEFGPFARSMGATESDGRYARFSSLENGYAAMDRLLGSYVGRGQNTVSSIIGRWAPANVDNNSTARYIASVAARLGLDPDDPVPQHLMPQLAEAMAFYEAGRPVPRP